MHSAKASEATEEGVTGWPVSPKSYAGVPTPRALSVTFLGHGAFITVAKARWGCWWGV